jgi:hypothetical protein
MPWAFFIPIIVLLFVIFGGNGCSTRRHSKVACVILTVLGLFVGLIFTIFLMRSTSRVTQNVQMPPRSAPKAAVIQMNRPPSPPIGPRDVSEPGLALDHPLPSIATTQQAQTSGKLWVDDFVAFVNRSDPTNRWLRAGTSDYRATESEAREEAMVQVYEVLAARLANSAPRSMQPSVTQIRDALNTDSPLNNAFLKDVYVQRVERPYGPVWSCTYLVDASQRNLANLSYLVQRDNTRQVVRVRNVLASLAGLALVVVLLYAFVNTVTRGYFAWRLRAVATLLLIGAVLAGFAWLP